MTQTSVHVLFKLSAYAIANNTVVLIYSVPLSFTTLHYNKMKGHQKLQSYDDYYYHSKPKSELKGDKAFKIERLS